MSDEMDDRPAALAGVAMTIAREHAALKKKNAVAREETGKGTIVTVVVVVAVLVLTLGLMLFMNAA
ncbi:MAG: hypothetical protein ACR2PA_12505 [Hyphomicrobiaceae bacterium]